jgi:Xaa-Pro dipeptidase
LPGSPSDETRFPVRHRLHLVVGYCGNERIRDTSGTSRRNRQGPEGSKVVRQARDSAVEFVRKNVRAGESIRGADVDDVSRGVITKAGYGQYFTHRTGHSIGEEVHGNGVNIDNFETRDSRKITPGVCFSIEPGIYLPGKFGVRFEIDVYVRENDIEVTRQPIQTEIVPILKAP